jgi:hypothetical protein
MAQLLKSVETCLGTERVLIARVLADDESIRLSRIDKQFLSLKALAAQHGYFGLHVSTGPALTIDLGQVEHHSLAIATIISAVGTVQIGIH